MRAVRLYMRNFKSYAETAPELDFKLFDVALLTGDNGNGKSSIADAIAWALWGQCKGVSAKSGVDDLVRMGADEMEVMFAFEEESILYKVIRRRDKKRAQSSLELTMDRGGRFIPAGGSTISETQTKIESIVKLDYDTYMCTAYLSQGKADMFAVKSPRERKEILAEILNLSLYDRLEKKASDKKKEAESKAAMLSSEIDTLLKQVSEEQEVDNMLATVHQALEKLQNDEHSIAQEIDKLQAKRQEKEALAGELKNNRVRLDKERRESEVLNKEMETLAARIAGHRKLIDKELDIVISYKRLADLRSEDAGLNEKFRLAMELGKQKDALEAEIKLKNQALTNSIKMLEQKMEQHRLKADDLENNILKKQEAAVRLSEIEQAERRLSDLEILSKQEADRLALLSARQDFLVGKHKDNSLKITKLNQAMSECPICAGPLDDVHKIKLLGEAAEVEKTIKEEGRLLKSDIEQCRNKRGQLDSEAEKVRQTIKARGKWESQLLTVNERIAEARLAVEKVVQIKDELTPLNDCLISHSYVKDLLVGLEDLSEKTALTGYDSKHHDAVKKEIDKLAGIQREWDNMQRTKAAFESDSESLGRLRDIAAQKKKDIDDADKLCRQLSEQIADLPTILQNIAALQDGKMAITAEIRKGEAQKGAFTERKQKIEQAKRDIKAKNQLLEQAKGEAEIYKMLAAVYGKSGIQAAIIENALPELEQQANEILSRITDGRLVVEFLTQRDKKSGGVMETLDIKISDESGTRKYETYSGGEEFRINFAIRIALAKVLAHRAGATLRMLILDEGFGVLDEQGREKLVEAINSIRTDFDNILVITHIQDLKDAFLVRIEVSKTALGSTFKIAE